MSSTSIYNHLRTCFVCLYDENGNERITPIKEIGERNLSEGRLQLLRNICKLVSESDIVSEYTKIYLKNKTYRMTNVHEYINDKIKERNNELIEKFGEKGNYTLENEVTLKQVQNKIQYDQTKLARELGSDIMTDIIMSKREDNILKYQLRIDEKMLEYGLKTSVRDKLDLNIRNDCVSSIYKGDFINDFGSIIYTYLKATKEDIEKQLNKNDDFVGYFNYLLSTATSDNEKVNTEREILNNILNGKVDNTWLLNRQMESKFAIKSDNNSELIKDESYSDEVDF